MTKKLTILLLCLILIGCKDETIPTATVELLPAELVCLSTDTTFDSIPYQFTLIVRDTILPDSIVIDTLTIDTLHIDTFYIDTIRLCGHLAYAGDQPYAPTLLEYGFCVSDTVFYVVASGSEPQTAASKYGDFSQVLPIRNTDTLFVYAYAINPFGEIRSSLGVVRGTDYDSR